MKELFGKPKSTTNKLKQKGISSIAKKTTRKKGNTIVRKMRVVAHKVKRGISNSIIGKTYRLLKGIVGKIVGAIKLMWKAVKTAYRAAKSVVKAAWKAAKAFWGASKMVGSAIGKTASMAWKGTRKMLSLNKEGKLGQAMMNFAPA